jgi:NAD(P)H-dependent flavin oxidoreductase YrpB (nitropropane dioxygenase family)
MLATAFTELVGCRVPVQLAAMGGGITTPALVSAVSRAGGLGMLQGGGTRPLAERIDEIEHARAGPFGVNFVPALGQGEQPDVELAATRARLVEFFFSDPDPRLVELVHAGGALAGWQVGSVEEAQRAVDAGCDLIVVQGLEAGGHVRGTVALLPLLAAVLDEVEAAVPVVAAGGIATARAMAAALAAGADGVRVGTRFLATPESGAHPDYVAALLAAGDEDTVLTTRFSIGWPDAPHRVLASAVAAVEEFDGEVVGALTVDGEPQPLPRFAARTPSREVTGAVGAMALYAGQGVGHVNEIKDVADIVTELADEAERLLRRWNGDHDPIANRASRPSTSSQATS